VSHTGKRHPLSPSIHSMSVRSHAIILLFLILVVNAIIAGKKISLPHQPFSKRSPQSFVLSTASVPRPAVARPVAFYLPHTVLVCSAIFVLLVSITVDGNLLLVADQLYPLVQ
jgi:hypothetical protein